MIPRERFDALIFDLDGVVTRTAEVHAAAWKDLFDAYLAERSQRTGESFKPFDRNVDYQRYVDGLPRYQGVQSFLAARGIELPWGEEADQPERETVCGIGNRKNRHFEERLRESGVNVYESTLDLIAVARLAGLRTGLASSSRNARAVLEAAGIADRFAVVIDGNDAARLGLAGKPEPEVFREAARRLGVVAQRAVVLEDAVSGVQAGRAGAFGLVVGVARHGNAHTLRDSGADLVVADLRELHISSDPPRLHSVSELPPASDRGAEIARALAPAPALFLDFDGTLAPIVSRPDEARLPARTRAILLQLAQRMPLGIISGRELDDVRARAGLRQIYCAGSHGFEIEGPTGLRHDLEQAAPFVKRLDEAETFLREALAGRNGVLIERKRFALAIHVRLATMAEADAAETVVATASQKFEDLRCVCGRKVYDFHPALDWHKGKALLRMVMLMESDLGGAPLRPLYIGDDTTDENALRAISGWGVGVAVAGGLQETAADYQLEDPEAVRCFLEELWRATASGASS